MLISWGLEKYSWKIFSLASNC